LVFQQAQQTTMTREEVRLADEHSSAVSAAVAVAGTAQPSREVFLAAELASCMLAGEEELHCCR